jgi:hypothetical protein
MAKIISFDKFKIENIIFLQQTENYETGEKEKVGELGEEKPVIAQRQVWKVAINYNLTGDDGTTIGKNKVFDMTDEKQVSLEEFVQEFVDEISTTDNITTTSIGNLITKPIK